MPPRRDPSEDGVLNPLSPGLAVLDARLPLLADTHPLMQLSRRQADLVKLQRKECLERCGEAGIGVRAVEELLLRREALFRGRLSVC